MKRDRKRINQIKKFWNLVNWEYCGKCGKEFVRETGWKMKLFSNMIAACKQCCPTVQDADTHFRGVEDRARKPKWKNRK